MPFVEDHITADESWVSEQEATRGVFVGSRLPGEKTVPVGTGLTRDRFVIPFSIEEYQTAFNALRQLFGEHRLRQLELNDRLFEGMCITIIIPDEAAGEKYIADLKTALHEFGRDDIQIQPAVMKIPRRVDINENGQSKLNSNPDALIEAINEVSGGMGKQTLARFLCFDNDLFLISCNTASLGPYLEDMKLYIRVLSEYLRAIADASLLIQFDNEQIAFDPSSTQVKMIRKALQPDLNWMEDLSQQSAMQATENLETPPPPDVLYMAFLDFLEQIPALIAEAEKSHMHPITAIATFLNQYTFGKWIRAAILGKVPLGGISFGMPEKGHIPGEKSRSNYLVLDNLTCTTEDLPIREKKHTPVRNFYELYQYHKKHGKFPPVILATDITAQYGLGHGLFSPSLRLKVPRNFIDIGIDSMSPTYQAMLKLEQLPLLQPLSQKMIWLNKLWNTQDVPTDLLVEHEIIQDPRPNSNIHETETQARERLRIQYWDTAAAFFTLMHALGLTQVRHFCTEMPLIFADFAENAEFRAQYGIDFDFPMALNPVSEVTDEIQQFLPQIPDPTGNTAATPPAPTE